MEESNEKEPVACCGHYALQGHEYYYEEFLLKPMPTQQTCGAAHPFGDSERSSFVDRAQNRAERASNIIRVPPKHHKNLSLAHLFAWVRFGLLHDVIAVLCVINKQHGVIAVSLLGSIFVGDLFFLWGEA